MKSFIKKSFKSWKINTHNFEKNIEKMKIDPNDLTIIDEIIYNEVLNNHNFLKFFVDNLKITGGFNYEFNCYLKKFKNPISLNIKDEKLKKN